MKRRYHWKLFWIGFMMNLTKNFLLLLPSIVLCIIGIWIRYLLYIGLVLFAIDIVVSFIEQWRIKQTVENSTNPNFAPWADLMSKDHWDEKIIKAVNEKTESQNTNDTDSDQTN